MSFKDQPYYHKFESLIRDLGEELSKMKEEKLILHQENQRLRSKLAELQNGDSGLFYHLSENDKHAIRGEITDMIRLVDKYISSHR